MERCGSCNQFIPDDANFCEYCGESKKATPIEASSIRLSPKVERCLNCKQPIAEDAIFCEHCGKSREQVTSSKKSFKLSRKILMAVISLFVIICGAMIIKIFLDGDEQVINNPSSNERLYYIDGNVYYGNPAEYGKNEDYLFKANSIRPSDIYKEESASYFIGYSPKKNRVYSNDGWVDTETKQFTSFETLLNAKPVAIQWDQKLPLKWLAIQTADSLYAYSESTEPVLISDNVKKQTERLYDTSNDLASIESNSLKNFDINFDGIVTYLNEKDELIQTKANGKKEDIIDEDVYLLLSVYEGGEMYYLKSSTETLNFMDVFEDKYKEHDDTYVKPDEFKNESERTLDQQVTQRQKDRKLIEQEVLTYPTYHLYYFDGKTSQLLTENYIYLMVLSSEKPVIVYSERDLTNISKYNLKSSSENGIVSNVIKYFSTNINKIYDVKLAHSGKVHSPKMINGYSFKFNNDETGLYFIDNYRERYSNKPDATKSDIFKITIKEDTIEQITSPVTSPNNQLLITRYSFSSSNDLVYSESDESTNNMNMYWKGQFIVSYPKSGDSGVLYLVTPNHQKLFLFLKKEHTLTMFDGNSSSEIMTEVADYRVDGDELVYVKVYLKDSCSGPESPNCQYVWYEYNQQSNEMKKREDIENVYSVDYLDTTERESEVFVRLVEQEAKNSDSD